MPLSKMKGIVLHDGNIFPSVVESNATTGLALAKNFLIPSCGLRYEEIASSR